MSYHCTLSVSTQNERVKHILPTLDLTRKDGSSASSVLRFTPRIRREREKRKSSWYQSKGVKGLFRFPVSWVGIDVEKGIEPEESKLVIVAVSPAQTAMCPDCGEPSQKIHSYYLRSPQDLPVSGYEVRLQLRVRRFRCGNQNCPRKTFAERLPEVVPLRGQRTTRLRATLTLFAVALSGQAGSRLLSQIGMVTSADTLLRLAKHVTVPSTPVPAILGVDDFAFRRGSKYGTILVDLSTHRPIDLLPERTSEALAAWLKVHPGVQWISRDRSGDYARGASEGAPEAQQIVDRWHILKNWREVLERVVGRVYVLLKQRQIDSGVPFALDTRRHAVAVKSPPPRLLAHAGSPVMRPSWPSPIREKA
jgi:transposase